MVMVRSAAFSVASMIPIVIQLTIAPMVRTLKQWRKVQKRCYWKSVGGGRDGNRKKLKLSSTVATVGICIRLLPLLFMKIVR